MKHVNTPKTNRTLELGLLIIMLCAGIMGIRYHLGTTQTEDLNIVMTYDEGSSPQLAYLSLEKTAEVGLPVQFALHKSDPYSEYLLDLGKGQMIDIEAAEFQYVFQQPGTFPIRLILRTKDGDSILDTYHIEIKEGHNLAAY